ncbi:MAG TPA: aldehyde dehydrogenase family protein, partial [Alphaproteobacteria bacterium]|nr:aldehyde dehydrogenase family protein [Alphaproteobacteria bacterium]
MNVQLRPVPAATNVRHESMRIAGRKVDTAERVDVFNPYTNEVVGTVPRGTHAHAREAFRIAAGYRPKLTRYERQKILMSTAERLAARREEIADLITAESGLCKKDSLYEVGRA